MESLGVQNLLIASGRTLWMGKIEPELSTELGVEAYAAGGLRLILGFIKGHAHVTGGAGELGFSSRVSAVGLSHVTSAGITSVIDLLGTDDTTCYTKSLLAETHALYVRAGSQCFLLDGWVLLHSHVAKNNPTTVVARP